MKKILLLGDEAIAQGAIDAGYLVFTPILARRQQRLWNSSKALKMRESAAFVHYGHQMRRLQWSAPLECHIPGSVPWCV